MVTWWDYGYWITRLGRRLPIINPGGGDDITASHIFDARDEALASRIMDESDLKYVIVDYDTATFKYGIREGVCDVYYQAQEGGLVPVMVFYPEYYRPLAIRLYNFDGSQVIPQSTRVISYQEGISPEGEPCKEITSTQSFPTYEEAEAYVLSQESDNYRIVGDNPFVSPVPLEVLEHYRLIYSSESCIMQPGIGMISEVKIFEYIGD